MKRSKGISDMQINGCHFIRSTEHGLQSVTSKESERIPFFLYTIKPPDSLGVKKSLSGEIMKKILLASIMRMWSAKSQKQEETRRKMS